MIEVGMKAPDFTLPDQNGQRHRLSDYRGRPVVLYFYPKDDTPGCTKEACSFRDSFSDYSSAGIEILGVSVDDESAHTKFREKYDLPFTLLSDNNKEVVEQYGVWVEKNMHGKSYHGTARKTFLIDEKGIVSHIFDKVKPENHGREIMDLLSG